MFRFKIICIVLFLGTFYFDLRAQNSEYIISFLSKTDKLNEDPGFYQERVNEHLRNFGKLTDLGVIKGIAAIEGGGEIVFINAVDTENANQILDSDPGVNDGLYTYETLPIQFIKGGICEPIIPYETVPYDLIQFQYENDIASFKTNSSSEIHSNHQKSITGLVSDENVIMIGELSNRNGQLAIFKKFNEELLSDNQSIQDGYISYTISKLWITKGMFCESD